MPYVIHLDLESWLEQAAVTRGGDEPIYVQDLATYGDIHGVRARITSQVIATYADVGGTIHAARLIVEHASLLGDVATVREAVRRRARQALALVTSAIRARYPDPPRPGLLLTPGLREDLFTIETDHDLWAWQDARDVGSRRLVPTGESADAS